MATRSKPPSRKSEGRTVPRRSSRGNSSPPRRPGRPGGISTPSFPWRWIAIGGGSLVLLLAIFFGSRALFSSGGAPTPNPTATPPMASTVTVTPTLVTTSTVTVSPTIVTEEGVPPDITALQRLMHQLINEDRRASGLTEVAWDEKAALAGTQHATEMSQYGYISHLNLDGYGPDYRYSMAGGTHIAMENVKSHSYGDAPQSAEVWEQWIQAAQESLMSDEAERTNILTPEHTHVGIGIAYDSQTGYLAIVQEFTNQYINIQPLPHSVSLGQSVELVGRINPGVSNPIINLAYEPLPASLRLEDLQPGIYNSPAEIYSRNMPVNVSDDGQVLATLSLNNDEQPGLYHIQVWADTEFGQVQVINIVLQVN